MLIRRLGRPGASSVLTRRLSRPGASGQATVELVGFLPLVALVALAAFTVLAAGTAHEQAGLAAEAGAVALLQDADAEAAARDALPSKSRAGATIRLSGRRVTVSVRPRLPLIARHLEARVVADAGPEPRP
jgi:hypothetical protein